MPERVEARSTAAFDSQVLRFYRQREAAEFLQHPDFWSAGARYCEGNLAHYGRISPALRWLTRDMGRTAVLSRTMMRDAQVGRVTVSDLMSITAHHNTSSGGRVRQVIERAERAGLIRFSPGDEGWMRRRILPQPELIEAFRERASIELRAAAVVASEILPVLDRLPDDRFFRRFLANLSAFDAMGPDLRGPPTPSIRLFLQHEGGMVMLRDLFLRQSPERSRLLDAAPFSRQALARRSHTSRPHVARVFADAESRGFLCLPSPGVVEFSAQMSDELGWLLAATFQVVRASALAAMP